jgi:hypothetical protein
MYEGWVEDLDISDITAEERQEDPDRTFFLSHKKNTTKKDRAGIASITCIQSEECIRRIFAVYLNDTTPEGSSVQFDDSLSNNLLALLYSSPWCCDRHSDNFSLSSFFSGPIYTGNETKVKPPRSKSAKNRPVVQRKPLRNLLRHFRLSAHNSDPLRAIRPASFILSDIAIDTLTKVHPIRMKRPEDVIRALNETSEWGTEWSLEVFDVIHVFDNPSADPFEDGTSASDSESGCESEGRSEVDISISPKRAMLAEEDYNVSVKRRRVVSEDVSQLRRSSRAVKPTYRILQGG